MAVNYEEKSFTEQMISIYTEFVMYISASISFKLCLNERTDTLCLS